MNLANQATTTWQAVVHQGNDKRSERVLLAGKPGSTHNFRLTLGRYGTLFKAPRHRHNFEQIRLTLAGCQDYGAGARMLPGDVGFFPEGVPYGPQVMAPGTVALSLAYGGPSGAGILSEEEMREAAVGLRKIGRFEDGMFYAEGRAQGKAGYNAMWEFVNRRRLRYPDPLFSPTLVMHSDRFAWKACVDGPGVDRRLLGRFSELSMEIAFLRIAAGATHRVSGHRILFVLHGEGQGTERWSAESAMEIEAGEVAILEAEVTSEIFAVRLS